MNQKLLFEKEKIVRTKNELQTKVENLQSEKKLFSLKLDALKTHKNFGLEN